MNDETREQIALFRFKLISPVLAEPSRVQNDYFRTQAGLTHEVPHTGPRRIAVSSFKRWLARYRRLGFAALKPQARKDRGRPRRLYGDAFIPVSTKCKAFPHWSIRKLYDDLADHHQLGSPPISYNTLARLVRQENLLPPAGRSDARKRFEHEEVNELWVSDFMHGPLIENAGRTAKAILCAIIDDHSRMITGYAFSTHETIGALTVILKDAFMAYGLPKRLYVDNGAAFSADLLTKACAKAGVSLIHSKPYDSPSRGKIERFFRTVRERFLTGLAEQVTLNEINLAFACWLKEDYHHKHHAGIDQKPIDRYQAACARIDIRRLSKAELDEIFLVRHERVVNNDATISFRGHIYEVPSAYIRQRIELRHPVDDDAELFLYDQGVRIAKLKRVDVGENARSFRPSAEDHAVSFARRQVTP